MSMTAMIAKAGSALLTNENFRKKAVTVVGTIMAVFLLPLLAVTSVFSGMGQVTAEDIQNNLSAETKAELAYM